MRRWILAIVGLAAWLSVWLGDTPQGPDSLNYMALLRSLVFDGDLWLANDLAAAGRPIFITRTGFALDTHNMGVTLFWLPFYLVAHAWTRLWALPAASAIPEGYGFGPAYVLWLRFADWCYGALALIFTYGAVRQRFSRWAALLSTGAVAIGSPFLYYMGALSPGTHAVSTWLSALVLYGVLLDEGSCGEIRWPVLGALAGLALSVASTNVGLLVFPLVYLAVASPSRQRLGRLAGFGTYYALAFLPQLLTWRLLTGRWLESPYHNYGTASGQYGYLAWTEPRWLEVLFSSFHGLFFYAPLLLPATVGLVCVFAVDRRLAWAATLSLVATVYLNSVALVWWGGAAFGARYLLGATPLFALGLAALLDGATRPWARWILGGTAAACAMWTALLYVPVGAGMANLTEYYSPSEQLAHQALALGALPRLVAGAPRPSGIVLGALPVFVLIGAWLGRRTEAALRVGRAAFSSVAVALVAIVLVGLALVIDARSLAARDGWRARESGVPWVRSDVDRWDLAQTLAERAIYRAKQGRWDEAEADARAAVDLSPSAAFLQRLLAIVESRRR